MSSATERTRERHGCVLLARAAASVDRRTALRLALVAALLLTSTFAAGSGGARAKEALSPGLDLEDFEIQGELLAPGAMFVVGSDDALTSAQRAVDDYLETLGIWNNLLDLVILADQAPDADATPGVPVRFETREPSALRVSTHQQHQQHE